MSDEQEREVGFSVQAMITNLQELAKKAPEAQVSGDEFDSLLRRAQRAFPASDSLGEMKSVGGITTLAVILMKLSTLQGAARAARETNVIAAVERQNRENQQRGGGPLLDGR